MRLPVRSRAGAWVAALGVSVALVVGCSSPTPTAVREPETIATADLDDTGPGSLVEAKTIPSFDRSVAATGATTAKVLYRSTSGIDGSPTVVSGTLFVPPGGPPAGGWPIIAFAHGTSGIRQECAPSASSDLLGSSALVKSYLDLGFAVAAADYQGLGTDGNHPYLDNRTAGLNVIDSVRALRKLSSSVSDRWAAFGGSQGGGATWAANEQSATYAPELDLVGTVSLVPAADMSGMAAKAAAGTLTGDQAAAYIWMLMGLEMSYPDFDVDQYASGAIRDNWDVLGACSGPEGEERGKVLSQFDPSDLEPASAEAEAKVTSLLALSRLPAGPASAPMIVVYGGQDEFIDSQWTENAIADGCAKGDVIEAIFQPDKGHGDVDGSATVQWLGERFGDVPPPSTC